MAHNQADNTEVEARVDWCYARLIDGYTQRTIVDEAFDTQDWGVSKRQIRNYVYSAQSLMATEAQSIDRRAYFTEALERYRTLYMRLNNEKDWKGAASIQDRIVDLLNLSADTALSINWRESAEALGVDPTELFERMLQELAAKDAKGDE